MKYLEIVCFSVCVINPGGVIMEGTVKFFDQRKNYGFIEPDEGEEDHFVHASDIESGSLDEEDRVEFESEEGDKGPRAVKVEKL